MLSSVASQLERESQHAVPSGSSENRLLEGHLLVCSVIDAPANVGVFPFVIFPDHAEIDLAWLPILQRSFNAIKKMDRAQIGVLPETAADGNQHSPEPNMIRHASISYCPQ